MENINKKVLKLVQEWDAENPAMRPLNTPDGYKSKYIYKQPIIHPGMRPNRLPADSAYEAQGKWGLVRVESDHMLTMEEIGERQVALKREGMICVGGMRLVKQTFSLDLGD